MTAKRALAAVASVAFTTILLAVAALAATFEDGSYSLTVPGAGTFQFTVDSGVQVYFCDPRSPWQRGTNENTVSVLRGPAGMLGQAGAGNDG